MRGPAQLAGLLCLLQLCQPPRVSSAPKSGCRRSQKLSAAQYVEEGAALFESLRSGDGGVLSVDAAADVTSAAAECFQLAADHPDSALPHVGAVANANLATALQKLGRDQDALRALSRAVDADPADVEALLMYGQALQKDGQLAASRQKLDQAVKLDASNARAVYALGTVLQQQALYTEALKLYERAVVLDRSYLPAQIQEAIILSILNECTRAEAKARFLRETFPAMDAAMTSALSAVYSRCGDTHALLNAYLAAISKTPGAVVEHGGTRHTNELRAGSLLLQLEKPEIAIDYLLAAQANDPHPGMVQGLLGYAYTQLGARYYGDALQHLAKACWLVGFLPKPDGVGDDDVMEGSGGGRAGGAVREAADVGVLANLVRLKYVCADWWGLAAAEARLRQALEEQLAAGIEAAANPVCDCC